MNDQRARIKRLTLTAIRLVDFIDLQAPLVPTKGDSLVSGAFKILSALRAFDSSFLGLWGRIQSRALHDPEEFTVSLPSLMRFLVQSGATERLPYTRFGAIRRGDSRRYQEGDSYVILTERESDMKSIGGDECNFYHTIKFSGAQALSGLVDAGWDYYGNRVFIESVAVNHSPTVTQVARFPRRSVPVDRRTEENLGLWNERFRRNSATVVLLHGPPGTGKSLFAELFAGNRKLLKIDGQIFFHEGCERTLSDIRYLRPEIVLIDDYDRCCLDSSKSLLFFERLHDLKVPVFVTVNDTTVLSEPLLRSGRIDWVMEFPLPDQDRRAEVLRLAGVREPEVLAAATEGYNLADLSGLVPRLQFQTQTEALETMNALRKVANRSRQ